MKIAFFNTKSTAERAFRMFVCRAALILFILSFLYGCQNIISEDSVKTELFKCAFAVDAIKRSPALIYSEELFENLDKLSKEDCPQPQISDKEEEA